MSVVVFCPCQSDKIVQSRLRSRQEGRSEVTKCHVTSRKVCLQLYVFLDYQEIVRFVIRSILLTEGDAGIASMSKNSRLILPRGGALSCPPLGVDECLWQVEVDLLELLVAQLAVDRLHADLFGPVTELDRVLHA